MSLLPQQYPVCCLQLHAAVPPATLADPLTLQPGPRPAHLASFRPLGLPGPLL